MCSICHCLCNVEQMFAPDDGKQPQILALEVSERLAQEQILFGILLVIAAAAAAAVAAAIAALLAIRLMSKTSASLFLMVKNNSALHDSNGETISFYWETTNLDNLNIPKPPKKSHIFVWHVGEITLNVNVEFFVDACAALTFFNIHSREMVA
ncbi:hypothetical protein GQX74_010403 [Glossina fuscipes]|nr:hypothetical protein GQX74_010403 [Glossina fuscipes]